MPAKSNINLLPRDRGAELSARILGWALSYGRYIVVLTELVVIIAFLMRFSLDQKLSDLYDSIKEKQLFVDANTEFEKSFRQTQLRLLTLKQLSSQQLQANGVMGVIAAAIPESVRLVNFSIAEGSFRLTAVGESEVGMGVFLKNLTVNPSVSDVAVTAVKARGESEGTEFSVSGKYDKK